MYLIKICGCKKRNLLWGFSPLACFGSLCLALGRSGCRSHFLVCKLLIKGSRGRKGGGGKSLTYGRDYFFGWGGQMEVAVVELLLLLLMVSGVVRGGIPVLTVSLLLLFDHGSGWW